MTVLAFGIRMVGIGFLLPHQIEPDGHVLVDEVHLLESHDPAFKRPHPDGLYPQLLPRLATLLPIFPAPDPHPVARNLGEHRERAAQLVLDLRIFTALFSVLLVPATWLLARRFFRGAWALVPPALIAVSVLHIWFTQQMRPHGPLAVLVTVSVLAAMHLRRKPGLAALVICGACAGLAIGCLQNGLAVLPPMLVAFLARERGAQESRPRIVLGSLLALVCVAGCVWFFYPFLFEHADEGRMLLEGDKLDLNGHAVMLGSFNGRGVARLLRAAFAYEPLMLGLVILGAILFLARLVGRRIVDERRGDLVVFLAFVVPYCIVIGAYEFSYQRFLLPLLPPAACLAAYALLRGARRIEAAIPGRMPRRIAVAAIVAVPFGLESFAGARLLDVRSRPDTITLAADWIDAHTRQGTDRILVLPTIDLPLLPTRASVESQRPLLHDQIGCPWFAYLERLGPLERAGPEDDVVLMPIVKRADIQHIHEDCASYFAELHGDYAVIETGFEGWGRPLFVELRNELQRSAVLETSFTPDGGFQYGQWLSFQENEARAWVPWTWRVVHARCMGPRIEIYRLRH